MAFLAHFIIAFEALRASETEREHRDSRAHENGRPARTLHEGGTPPRRCKGDHKGGYRAVLSSPRYQRQHEQCGQPPGVFKEDVPDKHHHRVALRICAWKNLTKASVIDSSGVTTRRSFCRGKRWANPLSRS